MSVLTYFYCPNPNCRRKLFFGILEKLEGFLNFRCHRCHTECTLGSNPQRVQVFQSASADRPARELLLAPST